MKGLLKIGLQSLQRYRFRFRVGPPHAQLQEFRVKLSATWESGPWRPPGKPIRFTRYCHVFRFQPGGRTRPHTLEARIQSQTPSNLGIGALAAPPGNQFDSQETVLSFDFSQTATRLLSFLDSDPQTPDGSQEVAMR